MFETFCVECGRGEDEGVSVLQEGGAREASVDQMPQEAVETEFHCRHCETFEVVRSGVMPTRRAECFDLREDSTGESLTVKVGSKEIPFIDIDEQFATSTHYTTSGVRSTARVHTVHINAVNPPTLQKGSHCLVIGDYLNEEMVLNKIRYHDQSRRTLEFRRILDRTDDQEDGVQRRMAHS